MKKFLSLVFVLGVLCTALGGCMQAQKLDERAIIQAIGIDRQNGEFKVTLQIFRMQGPGAQTSVDSSKSNSFVVSASASTIAEAAERISLKQGQKLFYGHNKLIVVGRKVAQEGLAGIISFFNSDNQTRPNVDIVMAFDTAEEVVGTQLSQELVPALSVKNMLESTSDSGQMVRCRVMDVIGALASAGEDIAMPVLEAAQGEAGEQQVELKGTALFSSGKLSGVLSPQATRGLLWARGDVKRAGQTIEDVRLGNFTLEVVKIKHRVETRIADAHPHFTLYMETQSHLTESSGHSSDFIPAQNAALIEQLQADTIADETTIALQEALQESASDVFDFCHYLQKYEPEYWQAHAGNYREELPNIDFEVVVRCSVTRFGLQG